MVVANRVEMTGMPQLVAALHSFVGLAAVFIGLNSDMSVHDASNAERIIHEVEIFLGVFIGVVTFTGSIIAYGKLAGKIGGKALILPGRHLLNLAMLADPLCVVADVHESCRFLDPLCYDRARASVGSAPCDGHRRCGHACRCIDAEFLLRLGGGGDRVLAR